MAVRPSRIGAAVRPVTGGVPGLPVGGCVPEPSPGGNVPRLSAGVDAAVLPVGRASSRPVDVIARGLSADRGLLFRPADGEAPAPSADGEAPAASADGGVPLLTAEGPVFGLVGRVDPSSRAGRNPSPNPPARDAPSVRVGRGPVPGPAVPGAPSDPPGRSGVSESGRCGAPASPAPTGASPAGGRNTWPASGPCCTAPSWPAFPFSPEREATAPSSGPPGAFVPAARVEASVLVGEGGSCVAAALPSARTPFGECGVSFACAGCAVSAVGAVPVPDALPGAAGRTMLGASRSTSTTMGMGWVSAKLASSARPAPVRLGPASVSVADTTSMLGAAGSAPASQSRSSLLPGRGPGSPASGLALPSSVAGRDGTR